MSKIKPWRKSIRRRQQPTPATTPKITTTMIMIMGMMIFQNIRGLYMQATPARGPYRHHRDQQPHPRPTDAHGEGAKVSFCNNNNNNISSSTSSSSGTYPHPFSKCVVDSIGWRRRLPAQQSRRPPGYSGAARRRSFLSACLLGAATEDTKSRSPQQDYSLSSRAAWDGCDGSDLSNDGSPSNIHRVVA